ncbi:pilus assembly protein N-terminal domain-containing protein [candidate division KSB1 bacterium]|nr:pilus assembly protein N-terminal domain-containing protein [candidate division KSB1 bacterium]
MLSTKKGIDLTIVVCLIVLLATNFVYGEMTKSANYETLHIPLGQTDIFNFDKPINRISITDPEVADATVTLPTQLLLTGLKIGKTILIVWDENEKNQIFKIVVHNEAATHQIMLQLHFVEVSKSAFRELGVDFLVKNISANSDIAHTGSYAGKVSAVTDPLSLSDNVDLFLSIPTQDISTIIKALEEKNQLHVLAKPNLVAVSGAEASFLAGGEFPVPIVQGSAGMQSVTILFKEYGVKLGFIPTVLDSELVNLKINAEVSSLDFENGVTLSGFRVPSLVSRKTVTEVELKKGEFLILGGLLSEESSKLISKIPVLGDIPILGKLFTSSRYQNKESELLIMASPKVIRPINEKDMSDINKL